MADKEEGAPTNPFTTLLYWAIGISIIWYIFKSLTGFYDGIGDINTYIVSMTGGPDGWYGSFLVLFDQLVLIYIQLATIISALLILATAYAFMRLTQIKSANKKKAAALKQKKTTSGGTKTNEKWQRVIAHANSENPAEWRLSILEADVLLDEVLTNAGFRGDSIGDKLKSADFKTVQLAWEAHKVRNAIAHEGADYLVNQREVKRVMELFEQVFKELNFI